jgi:hypothetical protein
LNAGTDDVEPETEIQIEDEIMVTTKYGQFETVSSTNDDIEDLQNFHNLGEYDGTLYWAVRDTHDLIIYSADGITDTSTTTEHTYDMTPAAGNNTYSDLFCKIIEISGKWYLCAVQVGVNDDGTDTGVLYTVFKNLSDDGIG